MDQALSPEVLGCALDRWAQFWGDPMLQATVSMLLYGVTGLVLLRVSQRTDGSDRQLWRVCAVIFLLQVINTHLDLHALPDAYGRCLSLAQGWYEDRGPVKMLGAVLLGAAMVIALLVAIGVWGRSMLANPVLVAGVVIVLGCTLIRGAGVNVVDPRYKHAIGPFRWVELVEYGGVMLAAFAGQRRLGQLRRARAPADRPSDGESRWTRSAGRS